MDDRFLGEIDGVTKQMLLGVIEKKEKWDRLKMRVKMLQAVTFLGFLTFFLYIIFYVVAPSKTIASIITMFFESGKHLYILLLLFTSYWGVLFLKKKCDKAEEEFHALRCEIIQKSTDLWKDERAWKERHKLFEMIKEKYDINLYYEHG
ncbi:YpbF family protein [Thermaerobacillus caldiproteolyticus]|uniref:DUF2663 domain-containing protein n=1 Tax=Thermaerobacillus caldiproteolyticus TaxID=247480 RepID=A0A7W0BYW9_9BACL|nr:YpbF family protein [Anoxybacillus caldiproteolyticus]MBA2874990.1 hypothetical protein [Anoxybacillus caldiproteolyticus]QPA33024.1 YpbF family protein [Anoxybacillus caldiproteolyticus]